MRGISIKDKTLNEVVMILLLRVQNCTGKENVRTVNHQTGESAQRSDVDATKKFMIKSRTLFPLRYLPPYRYHPMAGGGLR